MNINSRGSNPCVCEFDKNKTADFYQIFEKVFRQRFSVEYKLLYANDNSGHYAAECTVRDTVSHSAATRVGEVKGGESETPISLAYERAFIAAAKTVLELCKKEATNPADAPVAESGAELPDDEELLFGNMKGKTLGEVKDTPQFAHFLSNLLAYPDLKFGEADKQNQFSMLLKYAMEAAT